MGLDIKYLRYLLEMSCDLSEELGKKRKSTSMLQPYAKKGTVIPGKISMSSLNETYRVDCKLGSGGYGTVYGVIDLKTNKKLAMKSVRKSEVVLL